MTPKVYIVVLNYKSWEDTVECLESIFRLTYHNHQVIVVDNNSPNHSMYYIEQWAKGLLDVFLSIHSPLRRLSYPPIPKPISYKLYTKYEAEQGGIFADNTPLILVQAGENKGYSTGNNIGLRFALSRNDFEYIWILNNDTVVENDSLEELVKRTVQYKEEKRKIGLIGAKLLYYHQPAHIQSAAGSRCTNWLAYLDNGVGNAAKDVGQFNTDEVDATFISGACTFITKSFLEEVGLLGEDYFLYFEEPDWVERGKKAGYQELGYVWRAKVFHKEGTSIGGGARKKKMVTKFADYYFTRSKIIYTRKFHPEYLPTLYVSLLVGVLKRIKRGQWDRASMMIKLMLNPSKSYPSQD